MSGHTTSRHPIRRWLRALYYLNVVTVVAVVGYKVYLDVFDARMDSIHARQVERIQGVLDGRESFRFAVVGNVQNSIGIFERQIVPMLNASNVDFVVSAGNAVSDGGEDKYRALRGALRRLDVPHLLTFGPNEAAGLGSFRFYRQFGPYFFAFDAGGARFVFLDATGETPPTWQLRWLEEELTGSAPAHTFLFVGRPLVRVRNEPVFAEDEDYVAPDFRAALDRLIARHDVDVVFSGNIPTFDVQSRGSTRYVTTGGAGGLVVSDESSFHHFVLVTVGPESVTLAAQRLDVGQNPLLQTLESLWLFVHSLFFVGYLNFLLILSILVLLAASLHRLVFAEKEYYPRLDLDPTPYLDAPLRVAMFTNAFLPFIGGVPISVARLRDGLQTLGKRVLVIAPEYRTDGEPRSEREKENGVVRAPSILDFGGGTDIRVANIFHPGTVRSVKEFAPDLIHIHHPFWMGSLGLWLARRLRVPAIYTYHTRFEHYAHYVPLPGRLFRNLISHFLIKRFANKCAGVIVPAPSAREYLRTIGVKRRIMVQPTGIDFEAFRRVDPDAVRRLRDRLGIGDVPVILSVSRLGAEKNIGFILDAIAEVARRGDRPFHLLIVGEGDARAELERRAEELGIAERVSLPGEAPAREMPLYYHLAAIFAFASTTETQGMVVLEAMAAGLPVVAIRSSGIDALVREGVNGFKTGQDHRVWARRVEELLTDGAQRERLSRNAVTFAAEHDIESFARGVATFYAETLASEEREP